LFLIILTYFAINKTNLSKKVARTYLILFITTPFIFIFIAKYIVLMLGSRYSAYGSIESIDVNISTFTTVPLLLFLLFFYKKFTGEKQLYFKLFLMLYALSIVISLLGGLFGFCSLIFFFFIFFIFTYIMLVIYYVLFL